MNQLTLTGLSLGELSEYLSKLTNPLPRFRTAQIYKWISHGVSGFEQMTDIPNFLREELKKNFSLYSSTIDSCHKDRDTTKIVLALKDNLKTEAVLLSTPDKLKSRGKRLTACLSTQAGCPAGCVFCKTGSLGFSRDLSYQEIVEQFFFLRNIAGKETTNDDEHIIENIVIMGMGEPLLNLAELRKAITVFTEKQGINFSKRRITVSTCGICDSLFDIAENGPYMRLALSLTTADEPLRQKLMPITAANPLSKVKTALIAFQRNGGGRVTLEVPLLGGINTRDSDAASIALFAKGIDTIVNIIPWNPVAGLEFEGKPLYEPEKKETENFIKLLENHGLKVTKRHRKGRSVLGACGQLGAE